MVKAIKLTTCCKNCKEEIVVILQKQDLDKMYASLRMQELLKDLTVDKISFAQGINLTKRMEEIKKIGKRKPYSRP